MHRNLTYPLCLCAAALAASAACGSGRPGDANEPSIPQASALGATADGGTPSRGLLAALPSAPTAVDPTVPANGDLNPYGVAFVPPGFPPGGPLHDDDILVANFNDADNLQGTGTTIVRVNANASPSLFFSDANAPGFSTALGVLRGGFVLVGNVPSTDGSGACVQGADGGAQNVGAGGLLVIDRKGTLVQTLADPDLLDGPWDLTVDDDGSRALVFVSNVLDGTVTRLDLLVGATGVQVASKTRIA